MDPHGWHAWRCSRTWRTGLAAPPQLIARMNSKSTWFLLLPAAGLFAFIFFLERPLREAKQRPADKHLFPTLTFSNLTALQIRPAGRFDILVEKTNDAWRLAKPIEYPANKEF